MNEIALSGSDANVLRLTETLTVVFRPPKNGKNGHDAAPMPATFIRPPQEPPPPTEEAAPEPGTIRDADGQEYVAG